MAEKKKIKSLFNIAVDALTDQDEKAEAAAKEAAAKKGLQKRKPAARLLKLHRRG